jgi:TolB-like protein/Flp pilus assembly protein TadD
MAGQRFYQFGPFRFDATGRVLFREGRTVPLAPKVAHTLVLLVENAGRVIDKDELLKQVWRGAFIEEGSLTRTISVLRKALASGSDSREYIATISKRGYRFTEPVAEVTSFKDSAGESKIMLAVLPFENLSHEKRQEYFSDGLTEEMITQLGRLHPERVGVIARTSAMKYKGTDKSIQEIGRELGVAYILEGSVRRDKGQVRIAAQLIQVSDQTHIWAESYQRWMRDILGLQCEVAGAIARQIQVRLTPQKRATIQAASELDPGAYEDYLKGRYLWNKRSHHALLKSIEYFQKAIQRAPGYAPAYAGLADSYLTLHDEGRLPPRVAIKKAKAAARRALNLNESLAEPHSSLGHAYFHEFNWESAEREFQRGLELNPSYAVAHFYYANYLLAVGRAEEAVVEAQTARALDPVSAPAEANLAAIHYHARHFDQAIDWTHKLIETEPTFAAAYEDLGRAYEQKSMLDEAIVAFEKAASLSEGPKYLASLAHALALAGRKKEALALLQRLKHLARKMYVSPYAFSLIFLGLGDKDQALAWLSQAYRLRDSILPFLKVNPRLVSLHSDSRFQKLLQRLRLAG